MKSYLKPNYYMVNHTSPGLGHGLGLESDLQHLDLLIYLFRVKLC